jgi:acetyltransferase-like isoleucine patch superfamily enzyme
MKKLINLNQLKKFRNVLFRAKCHYFTKIWSMDIDPSARFSLSARFDMTYPAGVHLGPESYVAFEATILTHDMTRGLYLNTRIGRRCFIGAKSMILPGITVGDESIVAAGSVVTKDVPPRSIVAGNPARVIRENIEVGPFGRLKGAAENERQCLGPSEVLAGSIRRQDKVLQSAVLQNILQDTI